MVTIRLPEPLRGRWHVLIAAALFVATAAFFAAVLVGLMLFAGRESILDVVRSSSFHFAFRLTVGTSLCATVIACAAGAACAYILSRHSFRGAAFIDAVLDIPFVLPPLVSGLALLIFFGPGLDAAAPWLARRVAVVFTPAGVVVAQSFIALPIAIRLFREAFDSVDRRYEYIARTLGHSPASVFLRITVPLSRNALVGGATLVWARTLGEFGPTAMLAGVTRGKTETLAASVFIAMANGETGYAAVIALMLLLFSLLVLVGMRRFLRKEAGSYD
jgi:molybdate transport system permease protein